MTTSSMTHADNYCRTLNTIETAKHTPARLKRETLESLQRVIQQDATLNEDHRADLLGRVTWALRQIEE